MTQQIALGTLVLLKFAPHGEPGVVIAQRRGCCLVRWADLGMESKHRPENLTFNERESE